jgi:hypothetical protein
VDNLNANKNAKYNWLHVLIPGELKCNPKKDIDFKAWLNLAIYIKEVFIA